MRKLYTLILFGLLLVSFDSLATTVQGTIKKNGNFTVDAYVKPIGGNITGVIANFNLTISIDAQGETDPAMAPVLVSVTSLPGVAINQVPVEIINGRFVYAHVVTGNVTGGINWIQDNEYSVLTVVFPNTSQTFDEIIQLNDFGVSGGGNSAQALFDIGVQGTFYVDYANMFYGTNAVNVEFGDSHVEIDTPLPVTLVSFKADKFQDRSSLLSWSTASEINSSHFLVQRSTDKKSWSTIGKVNAAGNSQLIENYEFIDENIYNGLDSRLSVYYRLQMVDLDGQQKNSSIQNVVFGNSSTNSREFVMYPHPASDGVQIEWDANAGEQPTSLEFYDVTGKLIHTQKVSDQTNQEYVDFQYTNIKSGIYLLRIMNGTEPLELKQVVVGHNR